MKKYLQTLLMIPLLFLSNEIFGQQKNGKTEVEKTPNKEKVNDESKPPSTMKEYESTPQKNKMKNQEQSSASNSEDNGSQLPEDFPKYIDTGNPEVDKTDYADRKKQWIQENPEKYKAFKNGDNNNQSASPGKKVIPKSEFDQMSEEKKKRILSRPDKFIVK